MHTPTHQLQLFLLNLKSLHLKLFYALVFLIPIQTGLHFWPNWTTVLGRRVDYLSPTLYVTDCLLIILLMCWFIENPKRFFYPLRNLKILSMVLFWGIIIGSNIYFSQIWQASLITWIRLCILFCLGWYIRFNHTTYAATTKAFICGAIFTSSIGIAQFFRQASMGDMLWIFGERRMTINTPGIARAVWCLPPAFTSCYEFLRPYATFPHPNIFAAFLCTASSFIVFQTKKNTVLLLLVLGTSILLTNSGVGVFFFIFLLYVYITRKYPQTAFISTIFLGLLIIGVIRVIVHDTQSISERTLLNATAIKLFHSNPLTGTGLGTFPYAASRLSLPSHILLQPVHNVWLLWTSETGVAGILLIGFLTYQTIQPKKKPIWNNPYGIAFLGFFLFSMTDHFFLTLHQGRLLATIIIASCIERYSKT